MSQSMIKEGLMFETTHQDWYFITISSLVFFLALIISIYDFFVFQKLNYGIMNFIGLFLFILGFFIRLGGKRNLGKYYSRGFKTLKIIKSLKKGSTNM